MERIGKEMLGIFYVPQKFTDWRTANKFAAPHNMVETVAQSVEFKSLFLCVLLCVFVKLFVWVELIHKHIFFDALSLRYELFPLRFFKQKGRVKHLLGRYSEFVCDFYTAVFTNCNFIVAFKPLFNVFFVIWQNFTAAKTCAYAIFFALSGKNDRKYTGSISPHTTVFHT